MPSSLNNKVVFYTIHLNETLEQIKTNNVYDFGGAVGNLIGTGFSVQGSLLESLTEPSQSATYFSPLSNGETDDLFDVYKLKRMNTYQWGYFKGSSQIYVSSGSSSNANFVPLFIVTSDGYASALFMLIPKTYMIDETKISFSPCTQNRYGYIVSVPDFGGLDPRYNYYSVGSAHTQNDVDEMTTLYNKSKTYIPSTDPYDGGGTSTGHGTGGGGGTGDFDNTSDTIGIPALPTESGLNTGFFTAFVCSPAQMQQLSSYLWNNTIDDILDPSTGFGDKIDALKKVVGNPYDAIMGCSLIPVSPSIAGNKEVKMYGVIETGLSFPYASSRWVAVDCGTLNIHEFWGGYLDYSPYSKTTSLYLPFIGVVSIDIDLIMGKALQVVYHVDILSGICIAFVVVDGSVKFQYQGHCSTTIPITNADYSGAIQSGLGLVGNVANIVTSGVGGAVTGGVAGAVTGAVGSAISQAPSIASNVMGMKPDIKSGGGVGSSGGILSVKKPYLIIERPRQSLPERQNTFTGYPCNVTMSVGECSGYTEYETINLDGLFLTDSEKAELESILKGGVYL